MYSRVRHQRGTLNYATEHKSVFSQRRLEPITLDQRSTRTLLSLGREWGTLWTHLISPVVGRKERTWNKRQDGSCPFRLMVGAPKEGENPVVTFRD